METTTANLHWRIDLAEDAQTVLAFDGGDPAITRHRLGRGEVLTMTTAADPDVRWSDLASRPVFVSLIHELLSRSVGDEGGGAGWMDLLAGEPVVVPASVGLGGGGEPVLRLAGGGSVPLRAGQDGRYRSGPIWEPGLHRLEAGGRTFPVAVNVPAVESDVRRLDPAALRAALGDIDLATLGDDLPQDGAAADGQTADLGWPLLAAVLALAMAECFMAMRFGRARAA